MIIMMIIAIIIITIPSDLTSYRLRHLWRPNEGNVRGITTNAFHTRGRRVHNRPSGPQSQRPPAHS